jgi:Tol biopolymer transport system component
MRKLIRFAVVAAAAAAFIAIPAAANPPASNGRIAFTRFDPVQGDDFVYTANPDGSQERQLLPTGAEGPRWSPDGSRIAVGPHDVGGVSARIVNPDDGSYRDLANPHADRLFLGCGVWSPDAKRLACDGQSWDVDPTLNGIYTIRSFDGGGLERITADPGGEDCPGDYSPNGKRLVFLRSNDTTFALFTTKLDGGDLRQITPDGSDQFSINFECGNWPPQGNEILFSAHAPSDQRSTIWMVHSDGTGLQQIPIPGCGGLISDPTTIGCFGPSWSPDGSKIVFVRRSAGQNDVDTANADGTDPSVVSDTPLDEGGPPDWGTHPLISAQ